eukprot:858286-Pyramimonas_sp.AAC.1
MNVVASPPFKSVSPPCTNAMLQHHATIFTGARAALRGKGCVRKVSLRCGKHHATVNMQQATETQGEHHTQNETRLHFRTPLLLSNPMSEQLGKPVYLKMDAMQVRLFTARRAGRENTQSRIPNRDVHRTLSHGVMHVQRTNPSMATVPWLAKSLTYTARDYVP